MGWFDVTLVIFNEGQNRNSFLADFHSKLTSIDMKLDIDSYEFVAFNDTRLEEEKEEVYLSETMSSKDVIEILSSWPGLGLLSYRHPDFDHTVTINYLTWDDITIQAYTIGFNGKEVGLDPKKEKSKVLIHKISELTDYKYVVGDIYHDSNIRTDHDELPKILKYIEQTTFNTIDKRRNT